MESLFSLRARIGTLNRIEDPPTLGSSGAAGEDEEESRFMERVKIVSIG